MLVFALSLSLSLAFPTPCRWGVGTTNAAARGGYLKVLKYARKNGCPWEAKIISWASKAGHTPVVEWILENGCPPAENDFATPERGQLVGCDVGPPGL